MKINHSIFSWQPLFLAVNGAAASMAAATVVAAAIHTDSIYFN